MTYINSELLARQVLAIAQKHQRGDFKDWKDVGWHRHSIMKTQIQDLENLHDRLCRLGDRLIRSYPYGHDRNSIGHAIKRVLGENIGFFETLRGYRNACMMGTREDFQMQSDSFDRIYNRVNGKLSQLNSMLAGR